MTEHTGHLNHSHHGHQQEEDRLLTVSEVATLFRVDDTTVRRWIKHNILDAVHLPHAGKREAYRVRQSTVDKILAPALAEAV